MASSIWRSSQSAVDEDERARFIARLAKDGLEDLACDFARLGVRSLCDLGRLKEDLWQEVLDWLPFMRTDIREDVADHRRMGPSHMQLLQAMRDEACLAQAVADTASDSEAPEAGAAAATAPASTRGPESQSKRVVHVPEGVVAVRLGER